MRKVKGEVVPNVAISWDRGAYGTFVATSMSLDTKLIYVYI